MVKLKMIALATDQIQWNLQDKHSTFFKSLLQQPKRPVWTPFQKISSPNYHYNSYPRRKIRMVYNNNKSLN